MNYTADGTFVCVSKENKENDIGFAYQNPNWKLPPPLPMSNSLHCTQVFDPGSSIGVYLHLHVFGKTKATAVYTNVQFPSTIAFDDIKHFSVTVS